MALYNTFYLNFCYSLIVDVFNCDFLKKFCIKVLVIMIIEHFEVPFSLCLFLIPALMSGDNLWERTYREELVGSR